MRFQTLVFSLVFLVFFTCKNEKTTSSSTSSSLGEIIEIKYAEGFSISDYGTYKILEVNNPWPEANQVFRYALVNDKNNFSSEEDFDAVVQVPIKNLIVTSTTHIPSLEMLNEQNKLIGFPNLDFISSEKTRNRINANQITEIGNNESINTENVIALQPDVMIGFAVSGNNKTYTNLERAGIPVVYNGDWTEQSPLGKAEWIKFFGAFFDKTDEATKIFKDIENNYLDIKTMASKATKKPTVLSGAMWKDIWYLPQGNSWAAAFINDANAEYLWKTSEGTGSIALNIETVIEKAHHAEFWIGPGQFSSYDQMIEASKAYTQFEAFKSKQVYSFSTLKGETGGVIYYELAPNRPDLVLKDLVKILHPNLLPDYELYFFRALE
ncbi:ABC transporter substrate-binding protein [Paucihalobacter sp.]|uniref:ABC transporter substrate-binding protein n=1 Tax=Paucihalobacter sp. TaxID=2850405 RepID=UPI002FE1BEAE